MSAYVVDRDHIIYLVQAATSYGVTHGAWISPGADLRDIDQQVQVGQMLWDQNIDSVLSRYPEDTRETMPGPVGDDFILTEADFTRDRYQRFEPIQVIKACSCYAYQACENDAWKDSLACRFIDWLESDAIATFPGYEEAVWGAPPRPGSRVLQEEVQKP